MILFIVESPTKIKTIRKIFPKKAIFCATYGHIKDLPKKSLGIDIQTFTPSLYVIPTKKKLISELKKVVNGKVKEVYLATDPDREGEAISYHLYEILSKLKSDLKFKRLDLVEITELGIKKALSSARDLNEKLYESWLTRRVLDRLIGYFISPEVSRAFKSRLSAGRVQSIALRFIVEREREIKNFVPEKSYSIEALVKYKNYEFSAILFKGKKELKVKDKKEAKDLLNSLSNLKELNLKEINEKLEKKYPPYPLKTSTLIELSQKVLGLSAKETMFYAQRLYESGYITYMRTDSVRVSELAKKTVRKLIKSIFGENYVGEKRKSPSSRFVQDAHECIRPTNVLRDSVPLGEVENALYNLIRLIFIASQMAPAVFRSGFCVLESKDLPKGYSFRIKFKNLLFDGYTRLLKEDLSIVELPEEFKEGMSLSVVKVKLKEHQSKPPQRYTQASLIKKLESMGIGRPSTYPFIFDTLFKRKYIKKQKGYLVPTELGEKVCDYLLKNFPEFMNYEFTAKMEKALEEILSHKKSYLEVIRETFNLLQKDLQALRDASSSKA
ncbi:MAG: type I DNA topoisomerase [Thermodesulfobacteria bacterium]|nr:type I DNA topoisomerase [Thermodesulfobacteriota bacterium]